MELRKDFAEILMWSVSAADDYRKRADILVRGSLASEELMEILSEIPFGYEYLSGAHNYLQAACDNYFSLRLLSFPEGVPPLNAVGNIKFNLTIHGWGTLLRQFLENAANANWLLSIETMKQITERGFAVTWLNATERLKYSRTLNSPDLLEFEKEFENLISNGKELNLLINLDQPKNICPRIRVEDVTSKFRSIKSKVEIPIELIEKLGDGFQNGEWLYHWLSGLSHGLSWVHLKSEISEEEISIQDNWPDILRYVHSTTMGMGLLQDIFAEISGGLEDKLSALRLRP